MVDLELGHLIILIGGDTNEGAFNQVVGEDWIQAFLGDGPIEHHTRLILVHGIQGYHLKIEQVKNNI